jgi:hypothetical protein
MHVRCVGQERGCRCWGVGGLTSTAPLSPAQTYHMTIAADAIELRRPLLIRQDAVYRYPLLPETQVFQTGETNLMVSLSAKHSIQVSTAPSPVSALLVQLHTTLARCELYAGGAPCFCPRSSTDWPSGLTAICLLHWRLCPRRCSD